MLRTLGILKSPILSLKRPILSLSFSTQQLPTNDLGSFLDNYEQPPVENSLPPTAGVRGYPSPNVFSNKNPLTKNWVKNKIRLHCHSTRNNTITTLTKETGEPMIWFSGGSCGFKKGNRSTYEAGYQCAVRMFKWIEEYQRTVPSLEIDLFFKGFGQGREALKGALLAAEGERVRQLVVSITDRTPIKIGGTRAKKTRRL